MSGPLRIPQAALFVAVLTCVAFINSFGGKFVFDDIHEIVRNPHLEPLLPPWHAMFQGNRLPARPLPYLSFAIDRAIWGTRLFGYHLTNVVIHVIAALALFDLIRLTLTSPRLRDRWADRAVPVAMVIAAIWAIHPLQTQAVTYIYQRIESMTGMFCIVSLWSFAKAAFAGWSRRWLVASAAAAAAAMASKENAVVLPLLALAYDWFFVADETRDEKAATWLKGLASRWWYYLLLAATWSVLGLVLLSQQSRYQEFQELQHSPLEYLYTQSGVILHYIRLSVLPLDQRFDYGSWPVAKSMADVWPAFLTVSALVAATAVGTTLRRPWAWLGVVFFLALAPTSSIMPVEAVANEHRMYVALAAVIGAIVLGVTGAFEDFARTHPAVAANPSTAIVAQRLAIISAGFAFVFLVLMTQLRNQAYATTTGVWLDVLRKDRDNFRAYWTMASALDEEGDPEFATAMAEEAIRRFPKCTVLSDLAKYHVGVGNLEMAEYYLRYGYNLQRELNLPDTKPLRNVTFDLATVLRKLERFEEVRELCEQLLAEDNASRTPTPSVDIGASLLLAEYWKRQGDLAKGERLTAQAVEQATENVPLTDPTFLNAACLRADVLLHLGRTAEARNILGQSVSRLRGITRRSPEQQHFLDLFLKMLRESADHGGDPQPPSSPGSATSPAAS